MRLKSMDGPLAVHNGNNDILNSPKRINTLQNSNVTSSIYDNSTTNTTTGLTNEEDAIELATTQNHPGTPKKNLNNCTQKVRWCASTIDAKNRELANNYANNYAVNNQKNQRLNINSNLAAPVRTQRLDTYIVPSPDDSVLDFEEAQQSCSSSETTPQEEDKAFDVSDSESSDEGNLSNVSLPNPSRGILNPNYPGFQHLAHTLGFGTKPSSDTDDELESISSSSKLNVNSINNNNNNFEGSEEDFPLDKFESVNRLDSVENIQKVFHDKSIDIEECAGYNHNICDSESSGDSNNSDFSPQTVVRLNIKLEEKVLEDIVGDFRREVEDELRRDSSTDSQDPFEDHIARAVELELEEAVEKLQVINNFEPSAVKYCIEPNVTEPFQKLSLTKVDQAAVLSDFELVKNKEIADNMPLKADNVLLACNQKSLQDKIDDALLSDAQEKLPNVANKEIRRIKLEHNVGKENQMLVDTTKNSELTRRDSNRELEEIECQIKKIKSDIDRTEEMEKFRKEDVTRDYKEKEEDSAVPRKKEKIDFYVKKRKDYSQQFGSLITFPRRDLPKRDPLNRRSVPMARERKKITSDYSGGFDVYNIETAMPKIDLEAIECHLRAAREEERKRRTDREEIRRRLAMGTEDDYYTDRPGRKPSLQARLQSGMNLQICFMNETVSDTESPSSDSECPMTNPKQPKTTPKTAQSPYVPYHERSTPQPATRPATLSISQHNPQPVKESTTETDFFTRQARLQTEARMALAQAKEMARMQMEIERQRQKKSPITEMVRHSLEKVGIPFPEEKRRLSRQILTEMNVAQLQVIVNDLHTQIETLNENLVKFLMDRDDLHMEQDSMLVDIEDLTRYLGAKEQVLKEQNVMPTPQNNNMPPPSPAPSSPLAALNTTVKPHLSRIANLVKK